MAAPKQDIPLKRLIDEASGEASSLARDTAKITRNLRSSRRDIRDVGGLLDLLTGRVNVGNIRDVGGVAEMAAERLAKQGSSRAALQLMGVAGAARFAATAIGVAGAAAGVAVGAFELGSAISRNLPGSAESMNENIQAAARYQQNIFDARKRYGTPEMAAARMAAVGNYSYPNNRPYYMKNPYASPWSKLNRVLNPVEYLEDISDWYHGTSGASREQLIVDPEARKRGYMEQHNINIAEFRRIASKAQKQRTYWERLKLGATWDQEPALQAEFESVHEAEVKERDRLRKITEAAFGNSAVGLRNRSLANFRNLQLRKLEEQKWSGVKDWSL